MTIHAIMQIKTVSERRTHYRLLFARFDHTSVIKATLHRCDYPRYVLSRPV